MFHMSSDLMFCQKDIVKMTNVCVCTPACVCLCKRERENAFYLLLLLLIACCCMIVLDHVDHLCHRLLGVLGTTFWRRIA